MIRLRRSSRVAAGAVLALGLAGASVPALAGPAAAAGAQTLTGTLPDGATYMIEVPANWNGTLFLYSHGYVTPGSPNPATDVGDPITGAAMLAQGFALAGSSYAIHRLGHPAGPARPDQHAQRLRQPGRPAQADDRLGPLARRHHHGRPDPAVPQPVHRRAADVRRALRRRRHLEHGARLGVRLPAAGRPVGADRQHHHPPEPHREPANATEAATAAQATAAGRARLALSAALGDTPGWFTPLSPEPAANDFAAQEPTSSSGTPRSTSRSRSCCGPSSRAGPAATRPGTPA